MNRNRTLLVVDDSDLNRYLVRRMLESEPIDVLEAETGEEGVEQAGRHVPDYIFMDYRLPGIDGVEAIRRIRTNQELVNTKIFILTGGVTPGEETVFTDCPCDGVWQKPIDKGKLLALLAQDAPNPNPPVSAFTSKREPDGDKNAERETQAKDRRRFIRQIQEDFMRQLAEAEEKMDVESLLLLSNELRASASNHDVTMVREWADDLRKACEGLNLDAVQGALHQLPRLLQRLEKTLV